MFVLFSFMAGFLALSTVLVNHPILTMLFLILTFIICSLVLFSMGLDFFALILIIIYATGFAILFLFMMMTIPLNLSLNWISHKMWKMHMFLLLSLLCVIIPLLNSFWIINNQLYFDWLYAGCTTSNLISLGFSLYNKYSFCLLFAALSLFVVMMGAILLTIRFYNISKSQLVSYKQVKVNPLICIYSSL